jgi:hypothetical protein
MSVMSTRPVLLCRRCGRPLVVRLLATQRPDENGTLLREFMRNLSKIAYCREHRAQYNYYVAQGRVQDWLRGDV